MGTTEVYRGTLVTILQLTGCVKQLLVGYIERLISGGKKDKDTTIYMTMPGTHSYVNIY